MQNPLQNPFVKNPFGEISLTPVVLTECFAVSDMSDTIGRTPKKGELRLEREEQCLFSHGQCNLGHGGCLGAICQAFDN